MTYTGRQFPKEVHFSGIRYVKGQRIHEYRKKVGISIISALKRRALWRGTIFQRKVYETVNFRLQTLQGLYNFIRGFRRAYKQGAYYLTYYFDQHIQRGPIFEKKNKKKTVVSLATFVALQVWYGIPNERVPKSPLNSG